jgi:hypothetical protein
MMLPKYDSIGKRKTYLDINNAKEMVVHQISSNRTVKINNKK